ncbi:hypothetical protein [Rhodoferax bucti]|jgi:hypothetical protein|uniref:Uncharacterized protein n=1 Tax=Curvibacter symbiont subsp. Hydra magnipapillata TaxID=667019 RepID=C9YBD1_CURXX|nr:hypothetical protein [Rhodoferax bucti]CBA29870.1 hypothetical protein Csp_A14320 [Curvibacter putative symbiont of Hydra magnipapillata]
MTTLRHTVLTLAIATASLGAIAQTDAEHTQHHAAEPAKKTLKAPASKSSSKPSEALVAMDVKIKAMREMHEKMMTAKTPEERKALMVDHMKTMQDSMSMMEKMDSMGGMSMMGDMKGMSSKGADGKQGGMSMDMVTHHEAMQKRMEMMTTMMQMMMDRMPASPAQ